MISTAAKDENSGDDDMPKVRHDMSDDEDFALWVGYNYTGSPSSIPLIISESRKLRSKN